MNDSRSMKNKDNSSAIGKNGDRIPFDDIVFLISIHS